MVDNEIKRITNELALALAPLKIYLFGSYASGEAKKDSDFDFYVIVRDEAENLTDLTALAYKAIRKVRTRAVDIIVKRASEFEKRKKRFPFESEIANNGVVLYG